MLSDQMMMMWMKIAIFFNLHAYFSKEGEKVEDDTTEDPSYYDPKEDSTLADEVTVIKVCKSRVHWRYIYTHNFRTSS